MISNHAHPVSPRTHRAGFTLTEIVLALGIIAVAFVGVLGLLPAGLNASRQATNSTVTAAILEDLHNRLQGQQLKTGAPSFSPAFFDDHGVFIDKNAPPEEQSRRLYRAEVKIGTWNTKPVNTSALRPITITLSWPVDPTSGSAIGKDNPKTVVTYCATTLSGSDWAAIDSSFVPKIEY
ncbi:MAG: prepilin-type N-terminal cleavage/methylation domain-containing protein [Chthoniobacter sp.]